MGCNHFEATIKGNAPNVTYRGHICQSDSCYVAMALLWYNNISVVSK